MFYCLPNLSDLNKTALLLQRLLLKVLPVTTFYARNSVILFYILCDYYVVHIGDVICPIAIAYIMGQIIKSVCVCQCVCLSVCLPICEHSHGRISRSIFTKIGTDVRTPERRKEFVRGSISHHPFPILPQIPPF